MSEHAKRLIVQFMAANCGRSTTDTAGESILMEDAVGAPVPSNDVSLQRIHAIMGRMSQMEKDFPCATTAVPTDLSDFPMDGPGPDGAAAKDPSISKLAKQALATTGRLWKRTPDGALATPTSGVV